MPWYRTSFLDKDHGPVSYTHLDVYKRQADRVILELKVDKTPEYAISQIKEKQYALRFKGKLAGKQQFTGRILAVGINYDKETKQHRCKVEEIK